MQPNAIAYAILCHNNAAHVEEQFSLLWSPKDLFFYHVDAKAPETLHSLVATLAATYANVFAVPPLLCSWGGFSLVDAMLQLAAWSVGKAETWTHLVFLSEQHLPLRSRAGLRAALEAGRSYLACTPLSHFSETALADITHRFARHIQEVPGVGGFPVPGTHGTVPLGLHHGSQWMILSRDASVQLVRDRSDTFWQPFRASLLADETAIQTWFARNCPAAIRERLAGNRTFVSAPIDGGSPDMTFNGTNFFIAVQKDFLFIRKRPEVLPAPVQAYLDDVTPSAARPRQLGAGFAFRSPSNPAGLFVEMTFACLNGALAQSGGGIVDRMPPEVPGPPFFGLVRTQAPLSALRIFVMSGDLRCFKIAVMTEDSSEDYAAATLRGCETTLTKVRGWGVWHHRELHFADDVDGGVQTITSLAEIGSLAGTIYQTVRRSLTLTD